MVASAFNASTLEDRVRSISEFNTSLVYIGSSWVGRATETDLASKQTNKNQSIK